MLTGHSLILLLGCRLTDFAELFSCLRSSHTRLFPLLLSWRLLLPNRSRTRKCASCSASAVLTPTP